MSYRIPGRRQTGACTAEPLEQRLLFVTTVTLGTETTTISHVVTGEQVRLLPLSGRNVESLLTLTPHDCTADVIVRGNNLSEKRVGNIFEVDGSDFSFDSINVTNSGAGSSLSFKLAPGFVTTVTKMGTNQMHSIDATGVNFNGLIDLGAVQEFRANSIADSVVLFGAGQPTNKFQVGTITGSQITFNSPVNLFQSGPILPSTTTGGTLPPITTITVPYINQFNVNGDANLNLNIAGGSRYGLNFVNVKGAIAGGTWNVGGGVDSFKAGSVSNAWQGSFGKYAWNVQIKGAFDGTIQTPSITTARFGSADGAFIDLTQPFQMDRSNLGSLNVSGPFSNSVITSGGNMGRMNFNYIGNTTVFAGVSRGAMINVLPLISQLQSNAQISSFNVHGGYANTYLAAWKLRLADFGFVVPSSGNTQFGATTNSMGTMRFDLDNRLVIGRNIFQSSEFNAAVQRAHVNPSQLGNFGIRLSF
jgi:hypothetical protein